MSKIIFPLDVSDKKEAEYFIDILNPYVAMFKIGLELFYKEGPNWVKNISKKGVKIFLDLKLHDIPNTVYGAVKNLLNINPFFITVHLEEADKFRQIVYNQTNYNGFLAVTFLTSLNEDNLKNLYIKDNITIEDYVVKKAEIALNAGCCGVVCSAKEAKAVKEKFKNRLKIITPGIRLKDYTPKSDDQERVVTPYEAVLNGADYIVVGRPIRNASNPIDVCKKINQEIDKIP